jgi:hypothetical protein
VAAAPWHRAAGGILDLARELGGDVGRIVAERLCYPDRLEPVVTCGPFTPDLVSGVGRTGRFHIGGANGIIRPVVLATVSLSDTAIPFGPTGRG